MISGMISMALTVIHTVQKEKIQKPFLSGLLTVFQGRLHQTA